MSSNINSGHAKGKRTVKKGHAPTKPRIAPVQSVTVDPAVWAEAMRIAGGNSQFITILGPTSVVVHNRKVPRHG